MVPKPINMEKRKETRMLKLECGRCGVSFVMATEDLEYVTQVFCPSCRTPVELPPEEDDQDEDDLRGEEEDADEDE